MQQKCAKVILHLSHFLQNNLSISGEHASFSYMLNFFYIYFIIIKIVFFFEHTATNINNVWHISPSQNFFKLFTVCFFIIFIFFYFLFIFFSFRHVPFAPIHAIYNWQKSCMSFHWTCQYSRFLHSSCGFILKSYRIYDGL